MQPLTIGKLATVSGVNLETVRYYERIGLMSSPVRTANGHRAYEQEHLRRLVFIRRSRELGFNIENIRALLALSEPSRGCCADVKKITDLHLEMVRSKIADLQRLEVILAATAQKCDGNHNSSCPVLDMLLEK